MKIVEFVEHQFPGPAFDAGRWHCRTCSAYAKNEGDLQHSATCKWLVSRAVVEDAMMCESLLRKCVEWFDGHGLWARDLSWTETVASAKIRLGTPAAKKRLIRLEPK